MGRKPSTNLNLPKGMRARTRPRKNGATVTYYFYDTGSVEGKRREIPLGRDYILAVKQWAELEAARVPHNARPTFPLVAERYRREVMPEKAHKTQRDNSYQLKRLLTFFGGHNPAPLDDIKPEHIRQYLQWRSSSPVAANREIALFSHIWTMSSSAHWGYTTRPNPAQGIRRHKEAAREVYIEDYLYDILYDSADPTLRDAMDIAYLTGQRPADVLKIQTHHIRDGILTVRQNKTKAQLRFRISGSLKAILDRRMNTDSAYLFVNQRGSALSVNALEKRFKKLRKTAIARHPELAEELAACQFRDLRAKSGTDMYLKTDSEEAAKKQLGHTSATMTKRYIRRDTPLTPLDFCGTDSKIAEHLEGEDDIKD